MTARFREQLSRIPIMATLAGLLMQNIDGIPLTDLYLVHPVLRSADCPKVFPEMVENHIVTNCAKGKELVNSAVYGVETLLLLDKDRTSPLASSMIEWIKQQQLEDGGWHWRPKKVLPKDARSEVWITLAVYSLLAKVGDMDESFLRKARTCLSMGLKRVPEEVRGWSRLAYVKAALLIAGDPKSGRAAKARAKRFLQAAIDDLKSQQLPNGGWVGSEKTSQGGLFQTIVVLDALVQAGLDLDDDCVRRGFAFVVQRMDRLLQAKPNGVLIQALSIFCGICLRLKLIE